MNKRTRVVEQAILSTNYWLKFVNPGGTRGKTIFPPDGPSNLKENLGVRYDYDGEVMGADGIIYRKFQMQPNAGNIPPTFKTWRDDNGGTHAVMANVYVKKNGTKEDVAEALAKAHKDIDGNLK